MLHGIDLTRMECKVYLCPHSCRSGKCIDLTRMECKVPKPYKTIIVLLRIDLTRMECKGIFFGAFFAMREYRFNQNGM